MSKWVSWKPIWVLALLSIVCLVGAGWADEESEQPPGGFGKGKGKGKGKKGPEVVKVDLSKMPKELAKQVRDYIVEDETPKTEPKGEPKGKGKVDFKGKGEFGKGKGDFKGKDFGKDFGKEGGKSNTAEIEKRIDALIA